MKGEREKDNYNTSQLQHSSVNYSEGGEEVGGRGEDDHT